MDRAIFILEEGVANQIAAGEVVERPASVVKELVENSLDAGSRNIRITVRNGGLEGIEVQDDGFGMSAADAPTALKRHATSKIRTAADLEAIATLGFRGEALPSIAAVSRLELLTRRSGDVAGTRVVVEGGAVLETISAGCPAGTRVVVRDLFFNVPARRKHLRSPAREFARIGSVVTSLALARPDVSFHLFHNEKRVVKTSGTADLLATITEILGPETARELLPVRAALPLPARASAAPQVSFSLVGFVGRPTLTRSERSHQFFSFNGRPVENSELSETLETAFRTLLTVGRRPVAVLHLRGPFGVADVNVHPTKRIVRFSRVGEIATLIREAVSDALRTADLARGLPESARSRSKRLSLQDKDGPTVLPKTGSTFPSRQELAATVAEQTSCFRSRIHNGRPSRPPVSVSGTESAAAARPEAQRAIGDPAEAVDRRGEEVRRLASLRLLGQLGETYIVAADEQALYVVDQHAAHERVFYERLLMEHSAGAVVRQELAIPMPLNLAPAEAAIWGEYREILAQLGFETQEFGLSTIVLRTVPALFGGLAGPGLVVDLLSDLAALDPRAAAGGKQGERDLAGRIGDESERLIRAACRAAVKARDRLKREEMSALLEELAGTDNPWTCPHGRPTFIRLTTGELARLFKRT